MVDDRAFAVLATDVAVFSINETGLVVLLTKAKSESFRGMPTLPGGLVGFTEKTESAAKRILKGILSASELYIEQLYTFDDPKRDPVGRVVSVAYMGLIPWNKARVSVKEDGNWVSVKSLPKLAYDHNEVVKTAVKRIIGKLTYTNIVFGLMPEEFTLTELQTIYENILGRELDKRNFRKKISSLGLLAKLPRKRKGGSNRPAQLYAFKELDLREVGII